MFFFNTFKGEDTNYQSQLKSKSIVEVKVKDKDKVKVKVKVKFNNTVKVKFKVKAKSQYKSAHQRVILIFFIFNIFHYVTYKCFLSPHFSFGFL